jgi:hypothetical protein
MKGPRRLRSAEALTTRATVPKEAHMDQVSLSDRPSEAVCYGTWATMPTPALPARRVEPRVRAARCQRLRNPLTALLLGRGEAGAVERRVSSIGCFGN